MVLHRHTTWLDLVNLISYSKFWFRANFTFSKKWLILERGMPQNSIYRNNLPCSEPWCTFEYVLPQQSSTPSPTVLFINNKNMMYKIEAEARLRLMMMRMNSMMMLGLVDRSDCKKKIIILKQIFIRIRNKEKNEYIYGNNFITFQMKQTRATMTNY